VVRRLNAFHNTVGTRCLVHRKIALEHATAGAKQFYAGVEIGAMAMASALNRAAQPLCQPNPADVRWPPRDADVSQRPVRTCSPLAKHLFVARRTAYAQGPGHVVENYGQIRKSLRQFGELRDLRVEQPGIKLRPCLPRKPVPA
jgi:hypothetical protein